jgi:uncharacterized protein (DUF433 family)
MAFLHRVAHERNPQDTHRERLCMSIAQTLEGLITKDPTLHRGRPVLSGTGVAVRTVVGHYKLGLNAEEIADDMGLELALVYAALTYYHLNRDEIEADMLANLEESVRHEFQGSRV